MMENILPMLESRDIETINFARELIINEPLLNIIVGNETRTLHNLIKHCKPTLKRTINDISYYGSYGCYTYQAFYNRLSLIVKSIKLTLKSGTYRMWNI